MNNRRRFITPVPFAGAALLAACSKEAATPAATPAPAPAAVSGANLPVLQEADALAMSLGHVALASRADGSRYESHNPGQACCNCALFASQPRGG
jgi:hypothetical protein